MKYDVSIILPYYKKYDEFKYALELNKSQYEMVNEVIIIFDEVIDIKQFSYLYKYNIIFIFYTNTVNHEWRNPAVVINYGIKKSSSTYCIIMSPETILFNDFIKNLVENTDDNSFSLGHVIFTKKEIYEADIKNELNFIFDLLINDDNTTSIRNKRIIGPISYGSICCKKSNFEKINYYTEKFSMNGWGGEDDDVRVKLVKAGITKKILKEARSIHLEESDYFENRLLRKFNKTKSEILYNDFIKIDLIQ